MSTVVTSLGKNKWFDS